MPAAATVGEAPVRPSRASAHTKGSAEATSPRAPATSSAAVTVWSISVRRPAPKARAMRMLTEVPRHPSVMTRMKNRLLAKPTAAMAVAPSVPTTTWLTKFRTSISTNSALTGTAIRAISRRGVTTAGERREGRVRRGMAVPFSNKRGGPGGRRRWRRGRPKPTAASPLPDTGFRRRPDPRPVCRAAWLRARHTAHAAAYRRRLLDEAGQREGGEGRPRGPRS